MVEILNSTLILVELVVREARGGVEISLVGVQTNGLVAPGIFSRVPAAHLHLRPHRRAKFSCFYLLTRRLPKLSVCSPCRISFCYQAFLFPMFDPGNLPRQETMPVTSGSSPYLQDGDVRFSCAPRQYRDQSWKHRLNQAYS